VQFPDVLTAQPDCSPARTGRYHLTNHTPHLPVYHFRETGAHSQYWPYVSCVSLEQARDIERTLNGELGKLQELTEWARTLLCNATPSKVLNESQSKEWCEAFGKWLADANSVIENPEYREIRVGPEPATR
jgi:hypothetical protein